MPLLALVLVLAFGACGSERADQGRVTTVPTTASDPTTTASATVTPTIIVDCPSGMGAAAQGPAEAARCLHQGWSEGNRRKAAVFASLDVVEQLFQEGKGPAQASFEGCRTDSDTGREICSYDHEGRLYRFEVQRSEGGWRVTGFDSQSDEAA